MIMIFVNRESATRGSVPTHSAWASMLLVFVEPRSLPPRARQAPRGLAPRLNVVLGSPWPCATGAGIQTPAAQCGSEPEREFRLLADKTAGDPTPIRRHAAQARIRQDRDYGLTGSITTSTVFGPTSVILTT
jgi:hypothetical protein